MKLKWKRITAHTKHVFRIARPGSSVDDGKGVERTIVAFEHDGVIGLGEAAPTPYYNQSLDTVEATFAKAQSLLGNNPEDIDGIVDRLIDAFDDHRAAIAAIDGALHDWLGKKRGVPVWKMLGLDPARTPQTSMTVGIDTPEIMIEKVKEVVDFSIIKVKVGTESDVQTLTIVRDAAPDKKVRVDANCGWLPDTAIESMNAVLPFDLELIEQPLPAGELEAVKKLAAASPVPIVADEDSIRPSDVERLAGSYDGVNVKLSKCGGIREGVRMIKLARERGMKVMLGCMVETSVGVSAAAHIASLVDFVDLDGHLLLADDPFVGLKIVDGKVLPGDEPGLGVRPLGEFEI